MSRSLFQWFSKVDLSTKMFLAAPLRLPICLSDVKGPCQPDSSPWSLQRARKVSAKALSLAYSYRAVDGIASFTLLYRPRSHF